MRKSMVLKFMVSILICLTIFLPANALAASKPATPAIKSASGSATSITVKWNKVSGATKYKLEWRPAGGSWETDSKSKTTSDTSYDVTGLNEGKLYWFRLYAINDAGTSGKSPNLGCYTTPKAPTASIVDTTSIKVNWSGAGGNTRYELLYRKSGEGEYRTAGKFDNQYTHTVTGLTPGAEYYFKIKAYNLDDTSVVSGRSDSGHGYTKLNAPWINGKSANTVSLEWSRNSMDGQYTYTYRIRRKASYDPDYTNIVVVSGTSYTDTGLQPNTSYAYYIDVLRNGSYCVHSNVLYVQTDEIYAQSISLNETSLSLELGQTYQLYGNILPADTTNKNIIWSSSDSNIAKVDNGFVTAIAPGTAYITAATANGLKATCTVNVEKLAESISLNETSLSLELGQTYQLYGNILPADTTNKSIIWSSSDENVATVSENGLVTAAAYGVAYIWAATSNEHISVCSVFVLPPKDEDGLKWFLNSNGTLIIGGEGKMNKSPWRSNSNDIEDVIILHGVTSIGDSAFFDCHSLRSITIPDGVTSIGGSAFEDCTGLTSITIPNGITSIGDSAFSSCYNLKSITIPDSVTSIGDFAFSNCGLTRITIGNSVTRIGDSAFYDCKLKSITIPDSVTSIGDFAFSNCGLTSITIGNSVTRIGEYAFYDCGGLTSVTIPDSVTSIGYRAFSGCNSLTSITIPDSVISIASGAFSSCYNLKSITIPDSVTSIGDNAFFNCYSLKSITIPDSVTSIEHAAFAFCKNLTNITIPDSVTSIGECAFKDTAYQYDNSNWVNNVLYIGNHLIEAKNTISGNYCVKGNTKTIADYAFSGCDGLTSITIPDSVTSIARGAFSSCYNLKSITIPDSVSSIGNYAFSNCIGLTSITIPDTVTSVGDSAFSNCCKITSITIPDGVTSIGDAVFESCDSLTSITIPNSVTSIGNYAFSCCNSLTNITIPDSVTSIGDSAFNATAYYSDDTNWENQVLYIGNHLIKAKSNLSETYSVRNNTKTIADNAFYKCSGLTSISIPNSVINIGQSAFNDCGNLNHIYYIGTKEEWDKINIAEYNENVKNATILYCRRIMYNANGAVNTPQNQYPEKNTGFAISSEIPIRTGYSFLGWAMSADATAPEYQPGDTILIGQEDITLYAVWDSSYTTTSRSLNGNESIFTVTPTKVPVGSEIIIVCYKGGTLTDIQHQKNENKPIDFIVKADYDAVKVFVFDSFDGMIPLTDAENVEWQQK